LIKPFEKLRQLSLQNNDSIVERHLCRRATAHFGTRCHGFYDGRTSGNHGTIPDP
jgi:hypothetical protein